MHLLTLDSFASIFCLSSGHALALTSCQRSNVLLRLLQRTLSMSFKADLQNHSSDLLRIK